MTFPDTNRDATLRWNHSANTAPFSFIMPRKILSKFFISISFADPA